MRWQEIGEDCIMRRFITCILRNVYLEWPSQRRRNGCRYVIWIGGMNAYRTLVGKPQGKRPLRRPKHRWVDNIDIHLKRDNMGWHRLDWSGSSYGPVEGSCKHSNEPSGSKFLNSCKIGSFSRRVYLHGVSHTVQNIGGAGTVQPVWPCYKHVNCGISIWFLTGAFIPLFPTPCRAARPPNISDEFWRVCPQIYCSCDM
jgi:hypothetical protein